MEKYILSLDLASSTAGATLVDRDGKVLARIQKDFEKHYPRPDWIEFDPGELWYSQLDAAREVIKDAAIAPENIAAIGIANQRETTIVWDRETGKPIYNAIAWQDKRSAEICDQLHYQGMSEMIREKTGLILDAYFSASKIQWIINEVPGAKRKAEEGKLAFGTIDSWLVWKLTGGKQHITDVTNASRTLLFNIHTQQWDQELCRLFSIPMLMLPKVVDCDEVVAETEPNLLGAAIPIAGIAGDQHASLFGHACFEPGSIKNTYGSGCFLLMNTGEQPILSRNNLVTTIAWKIGGKTTYALEASVFGGSSTFRWLRDGLGIIDTTAEVEQLAQTETDNGGVYFVPAFSGLGSPYWDPYAKGMIIGISRGTTAGHIARASLEGVALGICDAVAALEKENGYAVTELKVDGSSVAYDLLLQLQTNLLQRPVVKPGFVSQSALGAAYLAGLAVGVWENVETIKAFYSVEKKYTPAENGPDLQNIHRYWKKAIARVQRWEF